ncbi:hypothetical protein YO5_15775 [Stutzerimonas stutzeri TS44]|nr:hypothetical protein YO5_15775 [Stutzerimonas stutzeri TS44]
MSDEQQHKPMTLRQMLQSMFAAALGVQSGKNRVRDFTQGKPGHFILLGIGFMVMFVLVLLALVRLVIHLAGA